MHSYTCIYLKGGQWSGPLRWQCPFLGVPCLTRTWSTIRTPAINPNSLDTSLWWVQWRDWLQTTGQMLIHLVAEQRNNKLKPLVPIQPPAHVAHWDPLEGHDMVKLPKTKRRNCGSVNHGGKRVRTSYECKACDIGICPTCFVAYHRQPRL